MRCNKSKTSMFLHLPSKLQLIVSAHAIDNNNNNNNNSDKAHIHSQKSAQGTKHKNKHKKYM